MEKVTAALRQVKWEGILEDAKLFPQRFSTGDFALIMPAPNEEAAVVGLPPRVAAHTVWRRALLWMAFTLSVLLIFKSLFDPRTVRASLIQSQTEMLEKQNSDPQLSAEQKLSPEQVEKQAEADAENFITSAGKDNIAVIDGLMMGQLLSLIASAVLQFMAAQRWRERARSQLLALWAVGVLLLFQVAMMLIPWSSMMDFKHLEAGLAAQAANQGFGQIQGGAAQMKLGMQMIMAISILTTSVPFFYSLFNGVLRASLAAKTLVPASIVCGWASILLAATIAVPWFIILSIVDQFQPDALIFLGALCLLAAPLSVVFKSRRVGAPLTSEEATPIVKRAKLLLTILNLAGVALLVTYLSEKDVVKTSQIVTGAMQYFAHLMLISVVAVDLLVRLLERAHRKLAADATPDESLRQLGEALPK